MVCAVMLAVLSACGGSSDGKDLSVAKSSSTPTPTRTTTGTLLDMVPPKPERPADEKTKAGAIAFADYFFKVALYVQGIADPAPLTAIIDADRCAGCKVLLGNVSTASSNGVVIVGTTPIATSKAKVVNVDGDFATVKLSVNHPERAIILAETGKPAGDPAPAYDDVTTVNLRWVDGAWIVLDTKSTENP